MPIGFFTPKFHFFTTKKSLYLENATGYLQVTIDATDGILTTRLFTGQQIPDNIKCCLPQIDVEESLFNELWELTSLTERCSSTVKGLIENCQKNETRLA
jgi:hypothetical protein